MHRRTFIRSLALSASALPFGRGRRQPLFAAQQAPPIIDALGEIRIEYARELLQQIRSSGLAACVVTVGNPALQGFDAFDDMKAEIDAYDRHIDAHSDLLSHATSSSDIARAAGRETLALIYYTQNASPIGDDVANLVRLRDLGVRIVQLTYNTRNLLGDGCLERTDAGLSRFGVEVVERMNELQLLVDASHCGDATTRDAIAFSARPIAITHAGCTAVFDHPRNKSDRVLRELAQNGGVIGIYQINPYLGPAERNTLGTYLDHIDHAINVAGIDHVGIGSDREYRTIPDTAEEKQKLVDELSRLRPVTAATVRWPFFLSELNHPRRMQTLADALRQRRRSAADIDKLLGANFDRLFRTTLG